MNPGYRLYYPRWYRKRVPIFWWLHKRSYAVFIARELTSVFVVYAAAVVVALVLTLNKGEPAWEAAMSRLSHPLVIAAHVLVLFVILFHTITWLNLAPMAIVVKLGDRKVPPTAVLIGHYGAWFTCSVVVAWLLLWR